MPKPILVGIITTAHGIKGAVKIKSYTQNPRDIATYSPLYDKSGNKTYEIKILSNNAENLVAVVNGISTRNEAEALRGTELYIDRASLPETNEEEFYYEDLSGLEARNPKGIAVGTVLAVHNYGAGDMLEIKLANGKAELLAFTNSNFPEINIKSGYIIVDFPEVEYLEGEE